MSLTQLVNVQVNLETSGVTRAAFGIPIFIGAHRWFTPRVMSFTSLTAAAEVLPTDSDEYKAVSAFFSQSPAPATVKVGRRDAELEISFTGVDEGEIYSIAVSDGTDTVIASYTVGVSEDEEDIVNGLKQAIEADPSVNAVVTVTTVGSGASTTMTIEPKTASDVFSVTDYSDNIDITVTTVESAADVLTAVLNEDSAFYFITAHDKDATFVTEMAEAVEAIEKMYIVSLAEVGSLAPYSEVASDTLAALKQNNYFRTAGMFHQDAATEFPECSWVGKVAPSTPGTITWSNKRLAGVPVSKHPTTGTVLTNTQLGYLADRNANFVYTVAGLDIVREGKVAAGEWADIIRSRDFIVSRVTEAYQQFLINSPKVPYTNSGINQARSVLESVLSRFITTDTRPNILDEDRPYTINFPRASEVSLADKTARVFDDGTFTAYLAGAIHVILVRGTLTYNAQA